MIKRFLVLAVGFIFVFTLVSCATIVSGRSQNFPVITNPSGAIVTVGGVKQMSPATFFLDRRQEVYLVKITKEGYEPVEINIKKGLNGWVFGNILFGGIIGFIVDMSTGSATKFTPNEVEVNLIAQQAGLNTFEGKDVLYVKLVQ